LKARKWASENLKMEVNKSFLSPALGALSHNLSILLENNLQYSFFPNSGSEAVDVALRLSFRYHSQSKHKILFSDRAFHGKSLGPQAISNSGENPVKTKTFLNVNKFNFNNSNSLKEKILNSLDSNGESDIAAVVIEPFSASTMTECSNEFLLHARHLCSIK
jgi:putrescine aminotransferase